MPDAGQFAESNLKKRYGLAIAAVVVLAIGGLLIEKAAFDRVESHSRLIRTAAEQWALVDQSRAQVLAASLAPSRLQFSTAMTTLSEQRDALMNNHEYLMSLRGEGDVWSPSLEAVYFEAPLRLDRQLRDHVRRIDAHLDQSYSRRHSVDADFDVSSDRLASSFGDALGIYEQSLDSRLDGLSVLSYTIVVLNLAALFILGAVVFRPVMDRLRREHQSLSESNIALTREVSERQKLAIQHASAEAKFRNAFENAPIGMGLMDADGYVFDSNPALRELFQDDDNGLVFDLADVFLDEDRQAFTEQLDALAETGEPVSRELQCRDSKGNELIAVINLSPVHGSNNEIQYVVLQVQDITESATLNSRLEQQASYDELTGLMNRRAFNREVESAWSHRRKSDKESFLLFMDLDQFKVINDTSGHAAGDQLLKRVSEIIKDCVRSDDIVCRLGGDEFGVVLRQCPGDVALRVAETIRASIDSLRFVWGTETYRIGVSIGVVALDPSQGDVNELQQLADSACYAAKENGRNCVQMVTEGKSDARRHRRQIRWVQRLREAMDKNRFAIYGQSIRPAAPETDAPERVEVLLRLRDPEEKRLIPPGAFLPAAERYGLNVELDEWVVTRLIDMLFVHHSFQANEVRYWVNLSGNSVGDERFARTLKEVVRRAPLPPGTINFEVTETAVIRNVDAAGRLMSELQDMGCEMALDDFGSGLSSFGYLKHLPIDYLKIDGMFIKDIDKDPTNRIFVKSIIDIAHSLDIETVAEFVENEAIEKIVTDLGIDYLQGFGISKPFVLAPKFPERPSMPGITKLAG